MGTTIPAFRIAPILEENEWKQYKKYLDKKDRKVFSEMFSIARLYNSACSYSSIPIRIYPIMISIVFHHYKILQERVDSNNAFFAKKEDNINNKNSSIMLQKELDKWKTYSDILRKPNRVLFNQMLQLSYKYSNAIDAKGENHTTESLLMTLLFEQYKVLNNY